MPAARDDYLLRLITQAAAAVRRFRERLTGGAAADEVARDAGAAIVELLGPSHDVLQRLDPRSAASILGDPDRVRAWSALLAVQADARRLAGDLATADRLAAQARALLAGLPPEVPRTTGPGRLT